MLHEEDDHANAVFVVSWLPNRGTPPPHDHGTWAVVASIEGKEKETMWRRNDDAKPGYADLEQGTEAIMTAGKVSCMLSGDIHTVWNVSDDISLSLHTYGKHVNFTDRSQFDPEPSRRSPSSSPSNRVYSAGSTSRRMAMPSSASETAG